MHLLRVNDRSRALCPECKEVRPTSYQERDVPFRNREGLASGVLVAVCDSCKTIVGIPHQSVPKISIEFDRPRHPIETRMPRHLVDALSLTIFELNHQSIKGAGVILRYYLNRAAKTAETLESLMKLVTGEEARSAGAASGRFSAKLDDHFDSLLNNLATQSGLTKAHVVRGIVLQAKYDVLDRKNPEVRRELAAHLQMAGA